MTVDIRDTTAVSEYGFLHPAIVDNINHRVDFVTVHLITIVLAIMFYYICVPRSAHGDDAQIYGPP